MAKRKSINREHIEGRVYQHNLYVKTVQNQQSENFGKEFIGGTLDVAVDEDGMNVLQVHFSYVTEFRKSGQKNPTYGVLKKIIEEGKYWTSDGKDEATKVKIDTAFGVNDFYPQAEGELVTQKINDGGFVSIVEELRDESMRNTFEIDALITQVRPIEPDEERGIHERYIELRGATFSFRDDLLPLTFSVRDPGGIGYFESLNVNSSNPIYTKVKGKINNLTIRVEKKEESAFGTASVTFVDKKTKEWEVNWAAQVPYEYGDENVLTAEHVQEAMQNREMMLADKKRQKEEYEATRQVTNGNAFNAGAAMNAPIKTGQFNF